MAVKFKPLSRRTFLRGAGVAVGLPLLDAMLPLKAASSLLGSAGGAAVAPVRMAFLYFPNGAFMKAWTPSRAGAGYDLPFSLTPLTPVRNSVAVLTGLDKPYSRSGDGHYAKTANFLTGLHVRKTAGQDVNAGGISIDQLAAARVGHLTPLPSLELATDPVATGIDRNVNYTRLYASYISWRQPNVPMPREINPRAVFNRLFGPRNDAGQALPQPSHDDDQSLLDLALNDAHDLRRRLGRSDQHKLDEYLDSVRNVERRLGFARGDASAWRPPTQPERLTPPPANVPRSNPRELVRLMLDMIVLAYWTDSTRISTFMFANDVSGRNFSFLDGVRESHHETSHHANQQVKIEQYQKIVRWHVEQFVYLCKRLRDIEEGERTLLDNSMIMFGSSFSDGNRHDPNNLPILVGGKGGGRLQSGQHLENGRNTPLCNLYVSMLDCMGIQLPRFGDSTGPLKGLT
jgi:Protein of unknown function (DUF1552)